MSDSSRTVLGYIIRIAAGAYLIYLSFQLFTGMRTTNEWKWYMVLFAVLFLVVAIFLIIVSVGTSSQRKNYRKSEQRLYELGKLEEAETEFSSPESIRFEKSKLVLSKQFVFCGASGWILPYGDIGWVYQRVQRSYGVPIGKQIITGLVNGKTAAIASKAVNDQLLTDVARTIYTANPDCLIGYSFENIKLYKQRVKEYKQSHPK